MKISGAFIIFASTTILLDCSPIMQQLYGVKEIKSFDKEKVDAFVASVQTKGIKMISLYGDTGSYNCIRKLSVNNELKNGLAQPVQMLYFDSTGDLVSFQANCFAKGTLTNLDWNTDNTDCTFVIVQFHCPKRLYSATAEHYT